MELFSREDLMPAAAARLRRVHTVLDIGPGIRPQTLVSGFLHVCVEPYRPYAELLSREHPDYVVLNCTWSQALKLLPSDSVDTVVLLDVIEHLEKPEGARLLEQTIRLARSQVVVYTPLGFMPQGENEPKDAWGMDGTDWQVHRSGWSPEDFPDWDILACERYHLQDAYGRQLEEPHGAFFAICERGVTVDPETQNELLASLALKNRTYEQSTSWRVTRPLRAIGRILGRG